MSSAASEKYIVGSASSRPFQQCIIHLQQMKNENAVQDSVNSTGIFLTGDVSRRP
jgi:hypothetical protein